MARVASTKTDVQDLEYVIEYLLVFTVSRRAYSSDTTITKGKNRVKLLQAALTLEKAMLELRDQEYLDAVDHVCVDIESIIAATLSLLIYRNCAVAYGKSVIKMMVIVEPSRSTKALRVFCNVKLIVGYDLQVTNLRRVYEFTENKRLFIH